MAYTSGSQSIIAAEAEAVNMKKSSYTLVFNGLLGLFSYTTQEELSEVAPPIVGWAAPHLSTIKKMLPRCVYGPIRWSHFHS